MYFWHIILEVFEDLDGEENLFFFGFVFFSLDDEGDESGDIPVRCDGGVAYSSWLARATIWS